MIKSVRDRNQAFVFLGMTLFGTAVVRGEPFSFVNWNPNTVTSNSVSGTIATTTGPVGVTLTGGFTSVYLADNFNPASTFVGGIVGNKPDINYNVQIDNPSSFTLTFSTPVTNLAYDLWSVGAPGTPVSYVFTQPFDVVAGGPNSQFGGQALVKSGNTVSGMEGNGVLLFTGTYPSISWNVVGAETYQTFTIGLSNDQTPEPASMAGLAIGAAALLRRRRNG